MTKEASRSDVLLGDIIDAGIDLTGLLSCEARTKAANPAHCQPQVFLASTTKTHGAE